MFIPASGWVADRYGARPVFRAAILVFTVGSVLCGLADGLPSLVASRVLQGIGGAMMVPVGRLVLLRTVAKHELVSAMAWLTVPALIGPVVGPPLGGLIVTYASWRWIFYINVPVGMLGILLVTVFVPDVREPPPGRFDAFGLVLSGLALAGLVFGLDTAGRGVIGGAATAGLIGGGLLCGAAFWRHARRHPFPVLDFGLMRVPSFAISVWAGTLFRVGIQAIPFLLPLMLQLGFGATAAASGAITFASSAGALVMKPVAPLVLRRFGFRRVLVWNAAAVGGGARPLRRLSAVLAGCGAVRRAAVGGLPALAAVHRLQHPRLCRHRAAAHEFRDRVLRDDPAALASNRRLARRGGVRGGDVGARPLGADARGLHGCISRRGGGVARRCAREPAPGAGRRERADRQGTRRLAVRAPTRLIPAREKGSLGPPSVSMGAMDAQSIAAGRRRPERAKPPILHAAESDP